MTQASVLNTLLYITSNMQNKYIDTYDEENSDSFLLTGGKCGMFGKLNIF